MSDRYLIALGSNIRHHRFGPPDRIIASAARRLNDCPGEVVALSPILRSAPLGPSRREYANAALIFATSLSPLEMLDALHMVEDAFGRMRRGQRWGARMLDCDIVLWSGGAWADRNLTIPHPAFRARQFVLDPAARIAGDWRDPLTGRTIRQLAYRNRRSTGLTRHAATPR